MTSDVRSSDQGTCLATTSPEVDFALVLSRVIGSIEADPSQMREAVYELARIKLEREAYHSDPPLNIFQMRRLMLALETAIERVEITSAKHDQLRALRSLDRLIESRQFNRTELLGPRHPAAIVDQAPVITDDAGRIPAFLTVAKHVTSGPARPWSWSLAAPVLRGCVVALFAVALCAILAQQFGLFGPTIPTTVPPAATALTPKIQGNDAPSPAVHPPSLGFPLPRVYGVYAASGGQLSELEALVGRVPDQKVFMSTAIKTSSRTVLPDGRIAFIVFRRDIAASAPERVAVRVVAKVMRAMTFNTAGAANTASVDNQWTIRSTSYEFRVAPLGESPEMLIIRPENLDFVFPAGRYGLVLKGQAYDFTVAGPITDAAQCLERIEAANGAFYSECRPP